MKSFIDERFLSVPLNRTFNKEQNGDTALTFPVCVVLGLQPDTKLGPPSAAVICNVNAHMSSNTCPLTRLHISHTCPPTHVPSYISHTCPLTRLQYTRANTHMSSNTYPLTRLQYTHLQHMSPHTSPTHTRLPPNPHPHPHPHAHRHSHMPKFPHRRTNERTNEQITLP